MCRAIWWTEPGTEFRELPIYHKSLVCLPSLRYHNCKVKYASESGGGRLQRSVVSSFQFIRFQVRRGFHIGEVPESSDSQWLPETAQPEQHEQMGCICCGMVREKIRGWAS